MLRNNADALILSLGNLWFVWPFVIYRQASKSTEPILCRYKLGIWNHTSVLVKSLKNHPLGKWNENFSVFSLVLARKREKYV